VEKMETVKDIRLYKQLKFVKNALVFRGAIIKQFDVKSVMEQITLNHSIMRIKNNLGVGDKKYINECYLHGIEEINENNLILKMYCSEEGENTYQREIQFLDFGEGRFTRNG
jgi:hypothetical protein